MNKIRIKGKEVKVQETQKTIIVLTIDFQGKTNSNFMLKRSPSNRSDRSKKESNLQGSDNYASKNLNKQTRYLKKYIIIYHSFSVITVATEEQNQKKKDQITIITIVSTIATNIKEREEVTITTIIL